MERLTPKRQRPVERGITLSFTKAKVTNKRQRIAAGSQSAEEDSDDSDEDKKEIKRLAARPMTRAAQLFESKDPNAGQLFVFVGKSERGKTHFMKWLIYDQMLRRDHPIKSGLVFVKTKYKHSYDFVPEERVIEGYNEAVLIQYVGNLQKMLESEGSLEPSFLIFEDLVGILNNRTQWFTNFIGTFRHLNITIYIAVQYLTGLHAVSPIMREQTSFAIMFNSKTTNTIRNLFENYGQLFNSLKEFKAYYFANTEPKSVGPYVCLVYREAEDDVDKNYIPMRAPKDLPKGLKLQAD